MKTYSGAAENAAFTEDSFWNKLSKKVVKACGAAAEKAVTMYFCMKDSETPRWAKTKIVGALAYLISPIDAIPDAIPVVGYTDDVGVLALAFVTVVMYIKPEHTGKARHIISMITGRFARRYSNNEEL